MTRSPCNLSLDNTIKATLSSLKDQFFLSVSSSTAASFECFSVSFKAFERTVHSVYDQLQQETLALVFSFASTVSIVASSVEAEEVEAGKLLEDWLDKLSLEDNNDAHSGSLPRYLSVSYQWLLQNLHNPYPSKNIRDTIAREANCCRKDVDSWFIDARKRIGWNALRKSRFSNKRSDIVDVAYRFFVEDDPKHPLPSDVELRFATIETLAKDLYSDKLMESTLAMKLDVMVKDMTFEMQHQMKEDSKLLNVVTKGSKRPRSLVNHYPSPSPEHSPRGRIISIGSDCSPQSLNDFLSLKRRCASSSSSDTMELPNKRPKSGETPPQCFSTGLLSPAASVEDITEVLEHPDALSVTSIPAPEHSVCEDSTVVSTNKRKRGLPEVDFSTSTKRPRYDSPLVQPQAVSEPVQIPDYILRDTPFGALFGPASLDIQSVGTDDLDSKNTYQIDVFDYSALNDLAPSYQPPSGTSTSNTPNDDEDEVQATGGNDTDPTLCHLNSYISSLQDEYGKTSHPNQSFDIAAIAEFSDTITTDAATIGSTSEELFFDSIPNLDLSFFEEFLSLDTEALSSTPLGFHLAEGQYTHFDVLEEDARQLEQQLTALSA